MTRAYFPDISGKPSFDEYDQKLVDEGAAIWNKREGPRVGDILRIPLTLHNAYRIMRFSADWGDDIQVSFGGSYYFGHSGYVSMSGGLEPSIPKSILRDTGETQLAGFWMFHHGFATAHNGVDFSMPVRVFEPIEMTPRLCGYRDKQKMYWE